MTTQTPANPERVSRADLRRGGLWSLAVVIGWIVLASWRSTVTYHLAPVLVAGVWPFQLRRGPLRVAPVDAARAAAAGGSLAVVAGLGLWAAGLLDGPTLWGSGHPALELVLAAAVGAVTGYRYARCGTPFYD
jgi:hypothetical protein